MLTWLLFYTQQIELSSWWWCIDDQADDNYDQIQSVGEQIYQVGPTASTSCKLCKGTSRLKTHIVDKLLVHEIWDSKFKQNINNIYREHLVKGPKKPEPERDAILKVNQVSSDVVMICNDLQPVNWTRRFWMLILPQDSPATQFMKTSYFFKVTFFKVHLDYSFN